jgi:hypothetical protein
MSPDASAARSVADEARQALAKVRPGPTEGRRALPIRRAPDGIRARWDEPQLRAAILEGIVRDASLDIGEEDRDWGRTVTVHLALSAPVPGAAVFAP